jgi:hypothetical protein
MDGAKRLVGSSPDNQHKTTIYEVLGWTFTTYLEIFMVITNRDTVRGIKHVSSYPGP